MQAQHLTFLLRSPQQTAAFAAMLGTKLRPGDTVLLEGEIGAGKTFFARSLIHSLQDLPEEVPSPTFTLVQTYDTPAGEVWHSDLYRLGDESEIAELGMEDAFESAICLVEWPDRLGTTAPDSALRLKLEPATLDPSARQMTLSWTSPRWNDLPEMLAAEASAP